MSRASDITPVSAAEIDRADAALRFRKYCVKFKVTPGINDYVCLRFVLEVPQALVQTPLRALFIDVRTTDYNRFGQQLRLLLEQAWLGQSQEKIDKPTSLYEMQTTVFDQLVQQQIKKFGYQFFYTSRGKNLRKLKVVGKAGE